MAENIFNRMAKKYDNEQRIELAHTVAAEMRKYLPADSNKTLLDYGCGTGLIGLQFTDNFKHLIFSDISEGMMEVVGEKIEEGNIRNAETRAVDELNEGEADIIIVSLVMIHVPEYKELIKQLYTLLSESGQLFIADFDKNDTVYHEKVHNGFSHDEMHSALIDAGFKTADIKTFYHGENIFMNKDASMFIASAVK
ncbi:S-adenosylmethionine-dependent methyltransferase [Jeotgalicoccus coquinae]|uniref:Ubiquinone/menaquinone biosynthesis C-methylase UbiE n=1 Tax=Jeotgalicoccus coquinae TaxID=709509 RepID=A0A6V7R2F3_9STAP|nr:methyltransferase domain-containing protein [Jeotgalicoccus coquinae]MBB6423523.1 ubiquinone/menaquinone biosynthesis C-methylase UbiE [Jeotgalicoccus coquinae]GGE20491.1 S-adenosylmethionine-dependent methyltransferase [Jeotgalicoccus coquinae]CAD2071529.1 Ubiquinone/menaquinone biosynthesis C-methyltransferase UbiE [Jeotgalicoccus coquinae]